MSQLQKIRTDLVEKRLWPLVALLVVALVAVPVLLRHEPAPPPEPVPAPTVDGPSPEATLAAASSVLGVEPPVTAKRSAKAPKGAKRDPFAVPPSSEPKAPSPASGGSSASSPAPSSGSSSSYGSGSTTPSPSSGSASSTPWTPPSSGTTSPSSTPRSVDPAPGAATKPDGTVYRLLRADLRFDGTTVHDAIRLRPLPHAKAPVALYLGPIAGGRGAAFVISGGAKVDGDGRCRPTRRLCTTLMLWPGEQATITSGETEHTLQLLRVRVDRTTSPVKAERFYARQSERGRCVLDVLDYLGYDRETGTVAPHHDARECEYVIGDDGATVGAR